MHEVDAVGDESEPLRRTGDEGAERAGAGSGHGAPAGPREERREARAGDELRGPHASLEDRDPEEQHGRGAHGHREQQPVGRPARASPDRELGGEHPGGEEAQQPRARPRGEAGEGRAGHDDSGDGDDGQPAPAPPERQQHQRHEEVDLPLDGHAPQRRVHLADPRGGEVLEQEDVGDDAGGGGGRRALPGGAGAVAHHGDRERHQQAEREGREVGREDPPGPAPEEGRRAVPEVEPRAAGDGEHQHVAGQDDEDGHAEVAVAGDPADERQIAPGLTGDPRVEERVEGHDGEGGGAAHAVEVGELRSPC